MTRLDLVVGPNGAGKTSFINAVLRPVRREAVVVNADEIAKLRWPGQEEAHAYDAAVIAAQTRMALIEQRRAFIAETVCSHPSKLELIETAQAAGFTVAVHVVCVPLELTMARVEYRVAAGGHSVPSTKVKERYERLWAVVAEAIRVADVASCWDNSTLQGPVKVASFTCGEPDWSPRWPAWADKNLVDRWPPDQ